VIDEKGFSENAIMRVLGDFIFLQDEVLAKEKGAIKPATLAINREKIMKKMTVGLMVAVILFFVSDCFAQELLVAIREGDTIWTKTCQTCAWTQVPGNNLNTAEVIWEVGLNRFVLYGKKTGGQIWKCTYDRGGKFQTDWVQVKGKALSIQGT